SVKQALIEEFMEEVSLIAQEMKRSRVPMEDLIQEGYVGLLTGIRELEGQDEDDGAEMMPVRETLLAAVRRAMEDAARAMEDLSREDRRLVAQVELLDSSISRLTEELGTKPNIDEIANDMGITQAEVISILKLTGDAVSDEDLIPPSGSDLYK
ncbi:MAG: sigma-70 domain-containing protein, partial [Lachnospiraceae bacterium]|nr:sigma-70 domain-containing protein [Lachnospiraceae bacterium]